MVSQMNFGEILRQARERKGYDVVSAARRLRIRPDILRAIEACDFERIPPRGYARNMVNAYARLVGLNATEITRMYLDAAYAEQVERARTNAQPTGFDMGNARGSAGRSRERGQARETERDTGRRAQGQTRIRRSAPDDARNEQRAPQRNAFGRIQYDDRRTEQGRTYAPDRVHSARGYSIPDSHYGNLVAAPRGMNNGPSRLPFIIAGVIIVLLLIIILFLVFGPKGNTEVEDVPAVPISGLSDTSNQAQGGSGEQADQSTPTAPTSLRVVWELPAGVTAYVEITENGTTTQEMVDGPLTRTVDVTGTWSLASWVSDITVRVDGEEKTFSEKNASGMPMVTVDFASYLAAWEAENAPATSDENNEDAQPEGADSGSGNSGNSAGTSA